MADEVDFVVVGGGSGGCAVASRLSEDSATSVALLEAGGKNDNWPFEGDGPLMQKGTVKFFNEAKGFGFVIAPKLCPGHPSCPRAE